MLFAIFVILTKSSATLSPFIFCSQKNVGCYHKPHPLVECVGVFTIPPIFINGGFRYFSFKSPRAQHTATNFADKKKEKGGLRPPATVLISRVLCLP